jgi:hypothetical protein
VTNTDEDAANTVTWGVFPGKEIVQPTIIGKVSFCAWKVWPLSLYSEIRMKRLQFGMNGPNYIRFNHLQRIC